MDEPGLLCCYPQNQFDISMEMGKEEEQPEEDIEQDRWTILERCV